MPTALDSSPTIAATSDEKIAGVSAVNPATPPEYPAPQRTGNRHWLIALFAALVLTALAGTWWWISSSRNAITYNTVPITMGPVTRVVTATGSVNPVLTIMVGSYVSGVIQALSCDYNTQVKKGQLCAKIDPSPYQAIVDQAVANVATAQSQLVKDKASLAYAKLEYDRDTTLLKEGIVSQDTFDGIKSNYDQYVALIGVDQATLQERQAELNTAQVNLGYTNITSPVNGTVVLRNVTMGQTVASSFQTPTLFLIASDLTKMQVDANVSESDVGHLLEGDRATFTVEAYPDRTFAGSVVQFRQAPQTVQNVVTYDIVVAVDNIDLALKPGMTATTKIVTESRANVLRVPDQALRYTPAALSSHSPHGSLESQEQGTRTGTVWVLESSTPHRVQLQLGLDDDNYTEVLGGDLKAGDPVIMSEQAGGRQQMGEIKLSMPRL